MIEHYGIYIGGFFEGIIRDFSFKAVVSGIFTVLTFLFGPDNAQLILGIVVLVTIDLITGLLAAKMGTEPITSRKAFKSAFKMAAYGLLVAASHVTEQIVPAQTYIDDAVIAFLAITELISILENTGRMGFAIPKKLLNQLHKMNDNA